MTSPKQWTILRDQGILEQMEAEMRSKLAKLGLAAVLAHDCDLDVDREQPNEAVQGSCCSCISTPLIDKGLKKIQRSFNFPNLVYTFALLVSIFAVSCFTVVGLLILSRWGK